MAPSADLPLDSNGQLSNNALALLLGRVEGRLDGIDRNLAGINQNLATHISDCDLRVKTVETDVAAIRPDAEALKQHREKTQAVVTKVRDTIFERVTYILATAGLTGGAAMVAHAFGRF